VEIAQEDLDVTVEAEGVVEHVKMSTPDVGSDVGSVTLDVESVDPTATVVKGGEVEEGVVEEVRNIPILLTLLPVLTLLSLLILLPG
jgi:hypothetical protein